MCRNFCGDIVEKSFPFFQIPPIPLRCRFGGWSIANSSAASSEISGTSENLVLWYNNKAVHALPSYSNALHNAMLRATAKSAGVDASDLGITTYNEPMPVTTGQFSAQTR